MRAGFEWPLAGAIILCGCGSSDSTAPAPAATADGPAFHAVADTKQLMSWIIDPSADVVWGAVGTIVTAEGTEQIAPKTDEQWTAIRNSAATVAEAGNLLMLPGRVRDQDWMALSRKMIDVASETLQAAEAKDTEMLFTAGGDLYAVCSECHAKYLPPTSEK